MFSYQKLAKQAIAELAARMSVIESKTKILV